MSSNEEWTMTPREGAAVSELIAVWRTVIEAFPSEWGPVTTGAQATALLSLFLNLTVDALKRTDHPFIRERMRTIAGWLMMLADTPVERLETVAQFLADEPAKALSKQ